MGKFSQNLRQAGILKEWNDQFPFRIWSCWRSEANRWSGVKLWIWMTGGLAICSNEKKEDIQIKIMYNLRHFYSTERKNGGGARSTGVSAQFPSPENRNPERFWYHLEEEKLLNKPVMEIEYFWPNTTVQTNPTAILQNFATDRNHPFSPKCLVLPYSPRNSLQNWYNALRSHPLPVKFRSIWFSDACLPLFTDS